MMAGLLEQRALRSDSMSKRVARFFTLLILSTAGDFYWGYHFSHSVGDGIVHVLGGFLVLAVFFGFYQLRKPN